MSEGAARLRVYRFEESGYFAALSKERAFTAVVKHTGCTAEDLDLENDFRSLIPDSEPINVKAEDSWGDPRETFVPDREGRLHSDGSPVGLYSMTLTAHEWANSPIGDAPEHRWVDDSGEGYLFGGSE